MAAQAAKQDDTADKKDPWLRTYFLQRLSMLDRDRVSYWTVWKDLSQQFAPNRGRFLTASNDTRRGARKDQRLINNTGLRAARTMASGMQAGISSPAEPWFILRLRNQDAERDAAIKSWLDLTRDVLLDIFARSNLYNALHTLYGNLGVFGTAALWVDEDEEDVVRGYVLATGEYWIASSKRLAVDTLYRTMWWTVRQIVDEFGRDNVPEAIRSLYDIGQVDLQYEVIHAIEPNPRALPPGGRIPRDSAFPWDGRLNQQYPFRSVWFLRGLQGADQTLLKVSGYEEFPCMAPRWEVDGSDTYGFGPGHVAIGDSQGMQVQERRKSEVTDKLSKPPMKGPPSMKNEPASLLPGGMTYSAEGPGIGKFEPAAKYDPNAVTVIRESVAEMQKRINEAFYADLFLMMLESDRRQITAREVDERHEEKMLMLGPVLERLHDELLDPLVKRVFNIAARAGLIPPPPEGLNLAELQIEFVSMLAQAQKAVTTYAMDRYVQMTGTLISLGFKGAGDRLDVDEYMDTYADRTGVPTSIVVPLDRAEKARAQEAQKQAQQEALVTAASLAGIGKTASEIDIGGGANAVSGAMGRA